MAWIIGDIHGCLVELRELLGKLPAEDQLIFVGDYVDRGPDSAGVVDRLLAEQNRSVFLLGNHEDMLLAHMREQRSHLADAWLFPPNGGPKTLASYRLDRSARMAQLPAKHQAFYAGLRTYYESEEFIVVHAGVRPDLGPSMDDQAREDLLWIRRDWLDRRDAWQGKTIYYGHTPTRYMHGIEEEQRPIRGQRSLGIDTGCVYGGYLTAVNTENQALVQVAAKQNYFG